MFNRTAPVAEPAPDMKTPDESPIPVSQLALDLPEPVGGWLGNLAARGVEVLTDDIGRLSISREAARMLFVEQRENEARQAELRAASEQRAIEADRLRRAQLGRGIPVDAIPAGMTYGEAVASAELDSQTYRPRASMVEDLFDGGGMVFHPIRSGQDEAS